MGDLHRIERAQREMLENAHDHEGYSTSDVAFHMAVYGASHNSLLRRFGHLVTDFMQLSFDVQQRGAVGSEVDFSRDAEDHAAVYHAINRGDASAAAAAMLAVVLEGKSALIRALSRGEDGAR